MKIYRSAPATCAARGFATIAAVVTAMNTVLAAPGSPFLLRFEKSKYSIPSDSAFSTKIFIDRVPRARLFSYAFRTKISNSTGLVGVAAITIVPAYDFDGPLNTAASVETFVGGVVARGTSDFFAAALPILKDKTIATLSLQPLPTGTYKLELLPFQALGPNEQLFVTGDLRVSDSKIRYGTATLQVQGTDPINTKSAALPFKNAILPEQWQADQAIPARVITPRQPTQWIAGVQAGVFSPVPFAGTTIHFESSGYAVEFLSQPGQIYHIEYSPDVIHWKTAQPPLFGTGQRMQWLDNGPPRTESHPNGEKSRFYRVVSDSPSP